MSDPEVSKILLDRACSLEAKGRHRAAFKLYLHAAQAGNVLAQVNLGNMYGDGLGVKRNFWKCIYWYRHAISAKKYGSAEAAHNLATEYRKKGNYRLAVFWMKKAMSMSPDYSYEDLLERYRYRRK